MKYKVKGEITYEYEIDVAADSGEDAIEMAHTCVKAGTQPSCSGLEYKTISKITAHEVNECK